MKTTGRLIRLAGWPLVVLLAAVAAACGSGQAPVLGTGSTTEPVPVPTIAPTVTAVSPGVSATGVFVNTKVVTVAFSKPMAAGTLTNASFGLTCPGYTPVSTPVVSYLAAGNLATLTLGASPNLPVNTTCTATVSTAAQDTTSLALATNFVWTFTTGATADTSLPRVTVTVPATTNPGPTTGVATNSAIAATFNENLNPATIIAAGSFSLSCALPCVAPAAVGGGATYAVVSKTATYTPATPLAASTTYTATIKGTGSGAVTDVAGNVLAGGVSTTVAADYVWTFTTAAIPVVTDTTPPTVTLVNPVNLSTLVCSNKTINATFSEAMNAVGINTASFTVAPTTTPAATIAGLVAYDALTRIATFSPTASLAASTSYTVTVKGTLNGGSNAVTDVAGNALVADKVWSFNTGNTLCVAPIVLGTATTFGMAATAGVTNTGTAPNTNIHGDVVLDPTATCNAVAAPGGVGSVGFGACGGFAPDLVGTVITPSTLPAGTSSTIRADMLTAFLSITPPAGPPAAGSLGGATAIAAPTTLGGAVGLAYTPGTNYFTPGVYQSITSLLISGDLTLDAQGDANAVFVFQSSSTVGTAAGAASPGTRTRILLIGGAKASNVWWQAATSATLGAYSEFQGNILSAGSITMVTGSTSCGRLLAGAFTAGAFVFDGNVVSVPGQAFAPPATYSTICQ